MWRPTPLSDLPPGVHQLQLVGLRSGAGQQRGFANGRVSGGCGQAEQGRGPTSISAAATARSREPQGGDGAAPHVPGTSKGGR